MSESEEHSKAMQAVAKTTEKALGTAEKLGGFLAELFGGPLEDAVGILGDRIKFIRWQRQQRIIDRYYEIIERRCVENRKSIPLKIALPALESASLEEDDCLQDLWIRLLASASDAKANVQAAYIEIIRQLQTDDVRTLNILYESYVSAYKEYWTYAHNGKVVIDLSWPFEAQAIGRKTPTNYLFPKKLVADQLSFSEPQSQMVFDNLARMRLINLIDFQEDNVSLTWLGFNFVLACMKDFPNKQNQEA